MTASTNPLNQTTTFAYDDGSDQLASVTDLNGVVTSYSSIDPGTGVPDPLDRVRLVKQAIGTTAETRTAYSYPSPTQVVQQQDQTTPGDGVLQSRTVFDGFGRTVETDGFDSIGMMPGAIIQCERGPEWSELQH